MVAEAREAAVDPTHRGQLLVEPEALRAVPGSRVAKSPSAKNDGPPEVAPEQVRPLLDRAMSGSKDIAMVYRTKTGQRVSYRVQPERFAFKAEDPVFVGLDRADGARKTFLLGAIERLEVLDG
jgi:predicted DNA-binding transcriptional regulator YafY